MKMKREEEDNFKFSNIKFFGLIQHFVYKFGV